MKFKHEVIVTLHSDKKMEEAEIFNRMERQLKSQKTPYYHVEKIQVAECNNPIPITAAERLSALISDILEAGHPHDAELVDVLATFVQNQVKEAQGAVLREYNLSIEIRRQQIEDLLRTLNTRSTPEKIMRTIARLRAVNNQTTVFAADEEEEED